MPLGALAGLGAGAAAVFEIGNIITSFEKLNSEIENLTKPRDFSKLSLKEIEKAADEVSQAIEKLNADQKGFFNKSIKRPFEELWQEIKNGFKSSFTPGGSLTPAVDELQAKKRSDAQSQLDEANKARALRQFRLNQIEGDNTLPAAIKDALKLSVDFADKIKEASKEGGKLYAQAVTDELTVRLQNIAEKVARANQERVGATLGQVAARPEQFSNEYSIQAVYEGEQARQVQVLEAKAQFAREHIGGTEGLQAAADYMTQADQIRSGIGSLKPSERDSTGQFKNAIDSAEVFKQIRDNTKNINFGNR